MIVHLSKYAKPRLCRDDQGRFNEASCEPASFLALLSLHLGLAWPEGDIVADINALIDAHINPEDFYYKSYTIDPIGVSQRLVELMTEILLGAGADFQWSSIQNQPRLKQLSGIASEVESHPIYLLPLKLRSLIKTLKEPATKTQIASLILSEPRPAWPRLWRDLFSALETKGTQIIARERPGIFDGNTNLNRVAQRILDLSETTCPMDDQSILRVNGASVSEAADATAALIQSEFHDNRTLTIVRSSESKALDDALRRQNFPILGINQSDRGSGPAEILPLVLDLMTTPPNPATFLAFLKVEPNPLPVGLRRSIIRELNENAAVDSKKSCALVDHYTAKIDDPNISERAALWKEWLCMDAMPFSDGITSHGIEPILARLEAWASTFVLMPDMEVSTAIGLRTLNANIHSLRNAMTTVAKRPMTRIRFQNLMAQVLSAPRISSTREQSSVLVVDHIAEVTAQSDTVIWWMAHDSIVPNHNSSTWTKPERDELARVGIELQSPNIAIDESYSAATHLLAMARQRFVVVTVDRIGDDPVAVHPIWYEIMESFSDESKPKTLNVQAVWEWLSSLGQKDLAHVDGAPHTPFHTSWEIPNAPYANRERESPSSLEKMLGCSLAWTLQYRAGLYDSTFYQLADGFLLLGILAHACFEEFFKSEAWILPQEEAQAHATKIFEHCLRTRAGILLTPGRDRERLDAESKTVTGMLDLAQIMIDGGWEFVAAEETVEAQDLAQPIRGRLDLLFRRTKSPDEKLIVDVKYVGKGRRQQELLHGNAIQLATYSRILRHGESWPKTAYYIVISRDFLTVHGDIAPNLYKINGEIEADVWSRIEAAITATTERLAVGVVDVGLDEASPKALAEAGKVAPAPCSYCGFRLFCRTDRRSA